MKFKPLQGFTILDFSKLLPGPFCSLILSDLGARVIRVENIHSPDTLRKVAPVEGRTSLLFESFHRGKERIGIDLKSSEGQKIFLKLVSKADVLLESFRPQVLDKMGFGFSKLKRLNKKLILASITGYGQKGPLAMRAGHDMNFMAEAGLACGTKVPLVQWADLASGSLMAAIAILGALLARQKSKKGQHLDISMADGSIFLNMASLILSQTGIYQTLITGLLARYQFYFTKDEHILCVGALESKFWNEFCDLIGKPQWKDGSQMYQDIDPAIHQELARIIQEKTRDEWMKLLEGHDVCISPALGSSEVLKSEQYKKRGFFQRQKWQGKEISIPVTPLGTPSSKKVAAPKKVSTLLKELGYAPAHIKNFFDEGVVADL